MNPQFGGGLRDFLFSQITEGNNAIIQTAVQDKLNRFFSKVRVNTLNVSSSPDTNTISIFIKYSIKNTGIVDH